MPNNTIIENLNSVINTKNEFANIIRENGTNPGTVFSDYPGMIRSIIANGSGDLSSYYVHGDHVCLTDDPDYNLKDLLVNSGAVSWDGTSYDYTLLLTETHANEWFPTYSYVESKIPVIDENIVPKSTDTYTLGDSSYYYHTLYANRIQGNSSVNIRTGNNNRLTVSSTAFRPMQQNYNLGSSDYPFAYTYTNNLNFGYNTGLTSNSNYDVKMKINGNYNYQWNMYQFSMMNDNYRNNCSLGTFGQPWAYTYTYNLILNGTNIEDRFTSYLSIDNFSHGNNTVQLRTNGLTVISTSKSIAPQEMSYTTFISASNPWVGGTTMKNYVEGRLADIESRLTAAGI